MAINALKDYVDNDRDAVENFHGNQVVYIDWDKHRLFSGALAFPLPPSMPFAALVDELIPSVWGSHPLFKAIDWGDVEWILDDAPFSPDRAASLVENGIGHKSLLRFVTPGDNGIAGSGS